jgi:hypothetical protein
MAKNKTKILLDADVIIHFEKAGKLFDLPKIFKEEKVILDIVTKEITKKKSLQTFYEGIIRLNLIKEITFQSDIKVLQEYARLKKHFGDGESACMAYCKFNKDILASSNLKDIKKYCEDNDIQYVTTMDFLAEAFKTKLYTEAECDEFIYEVKSKGSKLPCDTIQEYLGLKDNKHNR